MQLSTVPSVSVTANVKPVEAPIGVDDPVAQRFQAVMRTTPEASGVTESSGTAPSGALASGSLGDSILATVTQASDQLRDSWQRVTDGARFIDTNDPPSHVEMLAFQGEIASLSVVTDMISKGVSKSIQGLEQLLKTQ
jgi:hypothetical protein